MDKNDLRATTGRLHSLDYLRGCAAFGIMMYHYVSWLTGPLESESFLGRVGIYGVSIFYVLSGLTLFYVYASSGMDLLKFYAKRFFRIYPLLILVTVLTIIMRREVPSMEDILLNISGAFSVYRIDSYIAIGAWSIGNELTFYLFFPVFVWCMRTKTFLLYTISVILFGVYCYFAFYALDPSQTLYSAQWIRYINPLGQVFLFLAGFLIGYFFLERNVNGNIVLVLSIVSVVVFAGYPVWGDKVNLVTGMPRMIFTAVCVLLCFCFFKFQKQLPGKVHFFLAALGEASYSLYLLHPIVWGAVKFVFNWMEVPFKTYFMIIPIVISILLSYGVYHYFERYFIRLGNSLMKQGNKTVLVGPRNNQL